MGTAQLIGLVAQLAVLVIAAVQIAMAASIYSKSKDRRQLLIAGLNAVLAVLVLTSLGPA